MDGDVELVVKFEPALPSSLFPADLRCRTLNFLFTHTACGIMEELLVEFCYLHHHHDDDDDDDRQKVGKPKGSGVNRESPPPPPMESSMGELSSVLQASLMLCMTLWDSCISSRVSIEEARVSVRQNLPSVSVKSQGANDDENRHCELAMRWIDRQLGTFLRQQNLHLPLKTAKEEENEDCSQTLTMYFLGSLIRTLEELVVVGTSIVNDESSSNDDESVAANKLKEDHDDIRDDDHGQREDPDTTDATTTVLLSTSECYRFLWDQDRNTVPRYVEEIQQEDVGNIVILVNAMLTNAGVPTVAKAVATKKSIFTAHLEYGHGTAFFIDRDLYPHCVQLSSFRRRVGENRRPSIRGTTLMLSPLGPQLVYLHVDCSPQNLLPHSDKIIDWVVNFCTLQSRVPTVVCVSGSRRVEVASLIRRSNDGQVPRFESPLHKNDFLPHHFEILCSIDSEGGTSRSDGGGGGALHVTSSLRERSSLSMESGSRRSSLIEREITFVDPYLRERRFF